MTGALDYLKKNTSLVYKSFGPAELVLTAGQAEGWKIKTPWGRLSPGKTTRVEIPLKNSGTTPSAFINKTVRFIATPKAEGPATLTGHLTFNWADAQDKRHAQTWHFKLTALPEGTQPPLYARIRATILNKADATPIHGARLVISNDQINAVRTTDPSGTAWVRDLPYGSYDLKATAFGYHSFSRKGALALKPAKDPDKDRFGKLLIRLTPVTEPEPQKPLGNDQPQSLAEDTGERIISDSGKISLNFGGRSYLPKGQKYQGQKFSYRADGPGTLRLTFIYRCDYKATSVYAGIMGGSRHYSSLHWQSPNGIASKRRIRGGSLYMETGGTVVYRTETLSYASIGISGPGLIHFTAYPESNPARKVKDGWVDDWYNATHTHYFGGSAEITYEFKGKKARD